ncbi:Glycerophosphoryl diester phosphodiesterase [hydrothermal vent metagenome]|uniref:Glycerophosphoryl diester phosphodiesterase n=1 Tax=hydrothermal vent metagenome TaxID=652676 RepID=A0A3B0U2V4_9ZZZZ
MSKLSSVFKRPIAHRGLHDRENGVIENSKSAFAAAMEKNYSIECDLQLSGDGVPMVFHDDLLDRLTNQKGALAKLSAGQLSRIRLSGSKNGDQIQSFAEFLDQIEGKTALVVELKNQTDGRNAELATAAVETARAYQGALAFKSFSPILLSQARAVGYNGPLGIIVSRFSANELKDKAVKLNAMERFFLRHMLHYPKTRFNFISANHAALKLAAVRIFRQFGFKVMAWTIRSAETERAVTGLADQVVFENYLPHRDKN